MNEESTALAPPVDAGVPEGETGADATIERCRPHCDAGTIIVVGYVFRNRNVYGRNLACSQCGFTWRGHCTEEDSATLFSIFGREIVLPNYSGRNSSYWGFD